jgi:hypothetical protein
MLGNAKSSCPSDLNHDGVVDGEDLALLMSNWGLSDPEYQLDGDGVVNGGDLSEVLGNWGPCPDATPQAQFADPPTKPGHDRAPSPLQRLANERRGR